MAEHHAGHGFHLQVAQCVFLRLGESADLLLRESQVGQLALAERLHARLDLAELKRRGMPLVLVVRTVDGVEVDNVQAGIVVARHPWELGHRRIGLVMGAETTSTSRDRVQGSLRFLVDAGAREADITVLWGEYTTESGYSNAMKLLSAERPVSAIAAGNDTIALGVLEAARRRGDAVPQQLSVIGFDDIPMAGSPLIGLTTIRQSVQAMARTAAARLVERMRPGAVGPAVHETTPIQLVQRSTTAPPTGRGER